MIPIARPYIGNEEIESVVKVMKSGMIACGGVVKEFEEKFASFNEVSYGVATTSGTTAIETALKASGINVGDKVLTTAFSFIASNNPIIKIGARPVFCDIDKDTFNISPDDIEKKLNEHKDIKALLIVHLYGQSCDMRSIMRLVKEFDLILIEDCCQSHGARFEGKIVGSFGHAGCYSFYPTKNMTTGEGGMVVCNDEKIYQQAKMYINHGMKKRYYHEGIGFNYRMTNIAAAIGLNQLDRLDDMNNKRKENAKYYDENIENENVLIPFKDKDCDHVYHQYTLKIKNGKRDEFVSYLNENEIGSGIYYPLSIPEQECYKEMGFKKDYKNIDVVKDEVVSIPVHPALLKEDLEKIVKVVNAF